jgi:hypothetical protein
VGTPTHAKVEKEAGEVSASPSPPHAVDAAVRALKGKGKEKATESEEKSWIKGTSKGGNMSLMTIEKR